MIAATRGKGMCFRVNWLLLAFLHNAKAVEKEASIIYCCGLLSPTRDSATQKKTAQRKVNKKAIWLMAFPIVSRYLFTVFFRRQALQLKWKTFSVALKRT